MPGHGENAIEKGDLESWEEVNRTVQDSFKKIESCDTKILFGHSFGGQVALYSILSGLVDPDYLILSAPTLEIIIPILLKNFLVEFQK